MARNDVYLYTNATSVANAVITSQTVTTAADFPDLVLGDSPTFNFYFTDGTASWPSFAGNAQYSVEWTLGTAGSDDSVILAHQTQATAITGGWSMVLPLNTGAILAQLNSARVSQAYPVVQLWQQIRVTDPTGYKTTYANIRTNLRLRTAPAGTLTPDDPLPSGYQNVTADAAGQLAGPSNFFLKTSNVGASTAQLQLNGNGSVAYLGAQGVKTNEYDGFYLITPTITDNVGRGFDVKVTYAGNPSSIGATGHNCFFYTTGSHAAPHVYNYQSWLYHQGTYTLPIGVNYWGFLDNAAGTGSWTMGVGFYFAGLSGSIADHWAFYDVGGSPTRHSGKVYIGEAVIAGTSLPNTQLYVTRDFAEVAGGLSSPTATFRSTDTAAVGVGGSIALGGESGAGTTPYNFAFLLGGKEQAGATYNGFLAFYTTDTGSNNSEKARITSAGNLLIGTTTDISGTKGLKVAGARVNFSALPTSASGLVAGDLWNDTGTVKVVT